MKPVLQRKDGTSIVCSQMRSLSSSQKGKIKVLGVCIASSCMVLGILIMVLA